MNDIDFLWTDENICSVIVPFDNIILFDIFPFFKHSINDRERGVQKVLILGNDVNDRVGIGERLDKNITE